MTREQLLILCVQGLQQLALQKAAQDAAKHGLQLSSPLPQNHE